MIDKHFEEADAELEDYEVTLPEEEPTPESIELEDGVETVHLNNVKGYRKRSLANANVNGSVGVFTGEYRVVTNQGRLLQIFTENEEILWVRVD